MKKTNGQSGITLIALVVTIVVLLILAGITITYVLSDQGIFNQAKGAAKESEAAALRDYMSLAQYQALSNSVVPGATAQTAAEVISDNFPSTYCTTADGTPAPAITDGKLTGSITVTVTKSGNTFTVNFTDNVVTVNE